LEAKSLFFLALVTNARLVTTLFFYWLDDSNKKEVTNEILMLISKVFKLKNDQFWNLEVGLDKSILVKQ